MAVQIQHSRGDIVLGNQRNLKDGQLFWSYINTDPQTSNRHSYSLGQLWIKDPSNNLLTEVSDRRSLDSLVFRGFLDKHFDGKFEEASDTLHPEQCHCHVGDFWIFSESNKHINFNISDILLITKTEYEPDSTYAYRDKLKSVEYIKILGSKIDTSSTDLDVENVTQAILELESRLKYNGTVSNTFDFYNLTKKKGFCYVVTESFWSQKIHFDDLGIRDVHPTLVKLHQGDFIYWSGVKWIIIPSGHEATEVPYKANAEELAKVHTFSTEHTDELLKPVNVHEALDVLNKTKAQLDSSGKVPYSQLPDSIRQGLVLKGKFYPLLDTSIDKNLVSNQRPWPRPLDEPELRSGMFWIIDCQKILNVQYVDKDTNEVFEINTGDWFVYIEGIGWNLVDNSDTGDKVLSIEATTKSKTHTLIGNVGFKSEGLLETHVKDNTVIFKTDKHILTQDVNEKGIKNYFPIYGDNNTLVNSKLRQELETLITDLGLQLGHDSHPTTSDLFGNFGIRRTRGATHATYNNHYIFLESAQVAKTNQLFFRQTNIRSSELTDTMLGNEVLDIFLPDYSSTLIGVLENNKLTKNYHTKVDRHGYVTDSLTAEIQLVDAILEQNYQDGFENVGIGRITSEDVDSGEITFYAKTKDTDTLGQHNGFFVNYHSHANPFSTSSNLREHHLSRTAKAKTHLVIHPTILEDEIETFVKMPITSGTLTTWEDLFLVLTSNQGVPLMIPAWETQQFRHRQFIGLDSSPMKMRINRPKHDNVPVERVNNLNENYGSGDKSTWSYIDSNQEIKTRQEELRGPQDDVLSFDAWLEVQRAVATKEAFIIPATGRRDGNSEVNDDNILDVTVDDTETTDVGYGNDRNGSKFQRILPSRTIYKNEAVYYSPFTKKLIPQDTVNKDVEMPAVGGVLLTSRSRIEGGTWW